MSRYADLLPAERTLLRNIVAFVKQHPGATFSQFSVLDAADRLLASTDELVSFPVSFEHCDHLTATGMLFRSSAENYLVTQAAYDCDAYLAAGPLRCWWLDRLWEYGDGKAVWPKILSGIIGFGLGVASTLLVQYFGR